MWDSGMRSGRRVREGQWGGGGVRGYREGRGGVKAGALHNANRGSRSPQVCAWDLGVRRWILVERALEAGLGGAHRVRSWSDGLGSGRRCFFRRYLQRISGLTCFAGKRGGAQFGLHMSGGRALGVTTPRPISHAVQMSHSARETGVASAGGLGTRNTPSIVGGSSANSAGWAVTVVACAAMFGLDVMGTTARVAERICREFSAYCGAESWVAADIH